MKYEIGDKILILHTDEEGEVIDIINDKMVMVNVRGVKFPIYLDQIDFPYFKRFSQKKFEPAKPKQFVDNIKKEKSREDEFKIISDINDVKISEDTSIYLDTTIGNYHDAEILGIALWSACFGIFWLK